VRLDVVGFAGTAAGDLEADVGIGCELDCRRWEQVFLNPAREIHLPGV
jgi:hypothetical protein